MRIYGKIIETIPEERIVKIEYDGRLLYLYMTRKVFKDFGPYFYHNPYIFVDIDNQPRKYGKYFVYDINYFVKVVEPTKRERKIFYDIFTIKKGVKKLLDKINYKMFLDLEFSLPAYYQSMPHVAEIVQYGIVIEDKDGNIVFEDSNLVNPKKKYSLNSKALCIRRKQKHQARKRKTAQKLRQAIGQKQIAKDPARKGGLHPRRIFQQNTP